MRKRRERERKIFIERWPTQDNGIFHTIWIKKGKKVEKLQLK
jgi:hypothetical protein